MSPRRGPSSRAIMRDSPSRWRMRQRPCRSCVAGAAMRFLVTRLHDWIHHPQGALVQPKDPQANICTRLRFHQCGAAARRNTDLTVERGKPCHEPGNKRRSGRSSDLYRWSLLGQSGTGRLGRSVLRYGETERRNSAAARPRRPTIKMELMAAIVALESLTRPVRADLYTDSSYVKNGITSWLKDWKARGWKTAAKKPVKNAQICGKAPGSRRLRQHDVRWHWVKGHAGHPENERADALARAGMAPFKTFARQAQDMMTRRGASAHDGKESWRHWMHRHWRAHLLH
jgi:ribonuclease HI